MSDTVIIATITALSSISVSITALFFNFRLFNSLEKRIEIIEQDLKRFFVMLAEYDKRISKLEDAGKK